MKISEHINTLNFAENLSEVSNLLINAQENVSFWGKRVITVSGYQESISLDEIARKVLQAGSERNQADNLTDEERVAGIEIAKKTRKFYEVTDTKIKNANWFTRFLSYIREFTIYPYTPRFHAEEGPMESYFRGYSEEKFIQKFWNTKNSWGDYSISDGGFGPPPRITVPEEYIRANLNAKQSLQALQEVSEEQFGDFAKDFAKITLEYLVYKQG